MTPHSEYPAFANPGSEYGPGSGGLTIREYFAIEIFKAIHNGNDKGAKSNIDQSIELAEYFTDRLEETRKKPEPSRPSESLGVTEGLPY